MVSATSQIRQHISVCCGDWDEEQVQVDALVCLGEAARRGHLLSLDPVIGNAPDAS